MDYEIVYLEDKMVAGLVKQTTNMNGQCAKDIGEMWRRFMPDGEIYNNILNKANNKAIGLYADYKEANKEQYTAMVGCEVTAFEATNKEIVVRKIPAGRYAKFIIKGHVQKAVCEFWEKLWNMPLDRKYTCDFEEYQNNGGDFTNQEIHIYIALK